jgi:hypothetical protein
MTTEPPPGSGRLIAFGAPAGIGGIGIGDVPDHFCGAGFAGVGVLASRCILTMPCGGATRSGRPSLSLSTKTILSPAAGLRPASSFFSRSFSATR